MWRGEGWKNKSLWWRKVWLSHGKTETHKSQKSAQPTADGFVTTFPASQRRVLALLVKVLSGGLADVADLTMR